MSVLDAPGQAPSTNPIRWKGSCRTDPRNCPWPDPSTPSHAGGDLGFVQGPERRPRVSIHTLLVETYRKRSKNLLLQTLFLDPVVDSVSNAEKMLDYMRKLQKEYLPAFAWSDTTRAGEPQRPPMKEPKRA